MIEDSVATFLAALKQAIPAGSLVALGVSATPIAGRTLAPRGRH